VNNSIQEGKGLYSAGRLHGMWPAGELLAKIGSLKAYRESIPATQKRLWLLLIGGLIATILFFILWLSYPRIGVVYFFAMLAGLTVLIAAIVMLVRLGSIAKYDEEAAAVLEPLIRCIGPDLAKGGTVKVNASLRPPTSSDLLTDTKKIAATANAPECSIRLFKREVADVECRLSDGTRLMAGIAEHTVEKIMTKKNPRGKKKTKSKFRRKIGIRVRLVLDNSRCQLQGTFRLPKGTSVRVRRHERGSLISLFLQDYQKEKKRLDAKPILAMLAGVYSAVTATPQIEPIPPGGKQ
jgi:hypothetical protein